MKVLILDKKPESIRVLERKHNGDKVELREYVKNGTMWDEFVMGALHDQVKDENAVMANVRHLAYDLELDVVDPTGKHLEL